MPSVASQPFRRITTSLLLVMPSASLHPYHTAWLQGQNPKMYIDTHAVICITLHLPHSTFAALHRDDCIQCEAPISHCTCYCATARLYTTTESSNSQLDSGLSFLLCCHSPEVVSAVTLGQQGVAVSNPTVPAALWKQYVTKQYSSGVVLCISPDGVRRPQLPDQLQLPLLAIG